MKTMKTMKTTKLMLVGLVMVLALGLTGVVMANPVTDKGDDVVQIGVNEVSQVFVETGNTAFIVGAPDTIGDEFLITAENASATKIMYTSIIKESETCKITATPADIPTYLTLSISASEPSGTGTVGKTTDKQIFVNDKASEVIVGIASGYTGVDGGSAITYDLIVTPKEEANVKTDSVKVVITYTILGS